MRVRKEGNLLIPILKEGLCHWIDASIFEQCEELIYADNPNPELYDVAKKVCRKHYDLIIKCMGGVN